MLNMLVASKNIFEFKDLFNEVLSNNENIRIAKLATNVNEIINILNNDTIDVTWLDMELNILPKLNLNKEKQDKYKKSIIVVTKNFKEIKNILDNKMVFDYVIKGSNKNEIIYKLNRLIENKDLGEVRRKIIKELKYIGYNVEYAGTKYLIEAIIEMYKNKELMKDNLKKDIYPIISEKFNKTPHNIKCNITRATECMYFECDCNKLKEYFGYCDDVKPTAKTVMFAVLNHIE